MAMTRRLLSASANGRGIAVAATATPGTLIHTAISGTVGFDEVYLWVTNRTGSTARLTLEWGGVTNADHLTESYAVPPNSPPFPVPTGLNLNGAVEVRAFADVASALNIFGFVNRIE